MTSFLNSSRCCCLALAAAILLSMGISPARALSPDENEKARLKACEQDICSIIVGRKPSGADLSCNLKKTWSKNTLRKGGKKSKVSWLFGDAQCQADIALSRATIISAVSDRKFVLKLPPQKVNCKVERSKELHPVNILIAPKIKFKKGKAKKIWLNLKKVNGPKDIKGLLWAVAKLEDSVGIFHKPMLKQVNKFLHNKCAKVISASSAN